MPGMLFNDNKVIKKNEDDKVAYLTTAEGIQAELIGEILRDNGIPCMLKERRGGGAVKVIAGFSAMGTDIYVARCRLEEAMELVEAYLSAENDDSEDYGVNG